MKVLPVLLLLASPALADDLTALCASNPAYSPAVMLSLVQSELQHDHDPAFDSDPPETLAAKSVAKWVSDCEAEMRADPRLVTALSGLDRADLTVGWDAYNTACADHKASKAQCVTAEVGSAKALKRLMAQSGESGARTLVQTCALVLQADPPMTEWRQCVDEGLAVHASAEAAARCKLSLSWHSAKTGAEAGGALAACLKR